MDKKYIVFYPRESVTEGSKDAICNHYFTGFDTIAEAVNYYNKLNTTTKAIFKTVTWKIDITDITERE